MKKKRTSKYHREVLKWFKLALSHPNTFWYLFKVSKRRALHEAGAAILAWGED